MSSTSARKARTILGSLLIGFLSGAAATSYVLLRYGDLIGFQRVSQAAPDSLPMPERIPQAPPQPQLAENQIPETMPWTEPQTQGDEWIRDWTRAKSFPTEPAPIPLRPDQGIQQQPRVISPPQDSSAFPADTVLGNCGVVSHPESKSPALTTRDVNELRQRNLLLPLRGLKEADLVDSFSETRGNHVHEAIDILAPRNTPILAVEDGSIARLWKSDYGGITVYQYDPKKKYEYYYAHLERYAEGLKEGDHVKRGQVIGYVGTSGNAPPDTPHLHFTIFKLTESQHWWEGTSVNPYLVLR